MDGHRCNLPGPRYKALNGALAVGIAVPPFLFGLLPIIAFCFLFRTGQSIHHGVVFLQELARVHAQCCSVHGLLSVW